MPNERRDIIFKAGETQRLRGSGVVVMEPGAHLEVDNHVISARLQVNPSDGYVLPGGSVSSQVHRHQVVQAPA